jgi:hypothetical protein
MGGVGLHRRPLKADLDRLAVQGVVGGDGAEAAHGSQSVEAAGPDWRDEAPETLLPAFWRKPEGFAHKAVPPARLGR